MVRGLALIGILVAATGGAAARGKMNVDSTIEQLAKRQLDKDLRIEVHKVQESLCGSSKPAYVINVKLRKLNRYFNQKTESADVESEWKEIKKYIIPANELRGRRNSKLMDAESCTE